MRYLYEEELLNEINQRLEREPTPHILSFKNQASNKWFGENYLAI